MDENDLISKCALLRHLDMAIDCKDCPRNINKDLYTCNMRTTSEGCTCSEVSQICCRITNFVSDVQPVNQWISVKDRLPEIGKSVLVIVSINAKVNLPLCTDLALEMRIGWLDDNGKWGLQFDSADRDEILYWMPLPEPPKDGDINE